MKVKGRRREVRGAKEGRALKQKETEEKQKILEMTYRKEEKLFGLALEFGSAKSEVVEAFRCYIYKWEK